MFALNDYRALIIIHAILYFLTFGMLIATGHQALHNNGAGMIICAGISVFLIVCNMQVAELLDMHRPR